MTVEILSSGATREQQIVEVDRWWEAAQAAEWMMASLTALRTKNRSRRGNEDCRRKR